MSVVDTIHSEVRNVALTLVNEVIEAVEGLYALRAETSEDQYAKQDPEYLIHFRL